LGGGGGWPHKRNFSAYAQRNVQLIFQGLHTRLLVSCDSVAVVQPSSDVYTTTTASHLHSLLYCTGGTTLLQNIGNYSTTTGHNMQEALNFHQQCYKNLKHHKSLFLLQYITEINYYAMEATSFSYPPACPQFTQHFVCITLVP
jgi:hypothetical protein